MLGRPVAVAGFGIANPHRAGELDVHLGPPGHGPDPSSAGSFKRANYRVFGLGPVVGGAYDYALVTDPSGLTLYVLARDVARFASRYEADVLAHLKELNFTSFVTRPRKSDQSNCTYAPAPPQT